MNGFVAFLSVDSTLKRLKETASNLKPIHKLNNQSGRGCSSGVVGSCTNSGGSRAASSPATTVKVFSPTEQVLEQAKENLKRNREEEVIEVPGGIKILSVKKARKSASEKPKPKPKSTKRKSSTIHKKYSRKKSKN